MIESAASYQQNLCLWGLFFRHGKLFWSQLSKCSRMTLQLCETYVLIQVLEENLVDSSRVGEYYNFVSIPVVNKMMN